MPHILHTTRRTLWPAAIDRSAPRTVVNCAFTAGDLSLLTDYPWTDPADVRPGTNQWTVSGAWHVNTNKALSGTTVGALAYLQTGLVNAAIAASLRSYGDSAELNRGAYILARHNAGAGYLIGIESYNNKLYILEIPAYTIQASVSVTIETDTFYDVIATLTGANINAVLGANSVNYPSATTNPTSNVHGLAGYDCQADDFQVTT